MKVRKANPLIRAIQNQIDQYKTGAKNLQAKADYLIKNRMYIRAMYQPMFATLGENDHVYIYNYEDSLQFCVYMRELESFKDDRLTTMLSTAMDSLEGDIKETDYAEYDHKEYSIKTTNIYADQVELQINAYVKSNSPTCRKIQTGTEIKEVPKFKFICE
jgi:hypothetical protein